MEALHPILKFGTDLGPVSILIQMLIWGSLGGFGCWRIVKRRVVSKDARIDKLVQDVAYWEGRFGEKEREAAKLESERDAAVARLPETALAKAAREESQGNQDLAARALLDWFASETRPLAEISRRSAEWLLGLFGERDEAEVVANASRFAAIAAQLDPSDTRLRLLEAELLALRAELAEAGGDPATADTLWDAALEYSTPVAVGSADIQGLADRATKAREAGDYNLARALWHRIHTLMVRLAGPDDPNTLTSQNNLAAALQDLGRTEEAERLHRDTWEARKAHPSLGPGHPDTLTSQNNLAALLRELGREDEANAVEAGKG